MDFEPWYHQLHQLKGDLFRNSKRLKHIETIGIQQHTSHGELSPCSFSFKQKSTQREAVIKTQIQCLTPQFHGHLDVSWCVWKCGMPWCVILGIWDILGYPQTHVGARISPAIPIRPYHHTKAQNPQALLASWQLWCNPKKRSANRGDHWQTTLCWWMYITWII